MNKKIIKIIFLITVLTIICLPVKAATSSTIMLGDINLVNLRGSNGGQWSGWIEVYK